MLRIIAILNIGFIPADLDNATYFEQNYFINPFEVGFSCFLCLKVGIVVAISNWKQFPNVYVPLKGHAHKSEVTPP